MGTHSDAPIRSRLREEILHCGLTQRQVAELLGQRPNYLSQVLRGRLDLKLSQVYATLAVLRVPPGVFFARVHTAMGDSVESLASEVLRALLVGGGRDEEKSGAADTAEGWTGSWQWACEQSKRVVELLFVKVRASDNTQQHLAEQVGLSAGHLSQLLRGQEAMKVRYVYDLLKALGCAPEQFFAELHPCHELHRQSILWLGPAALGEPVVALDLPSLIREVVEATLEAQARRA